MKMTCEECGAKLRVTEKYFGKWIPCPQCRTFISIPDSETLMDSGSGTSAAPPDTTGYRLRSDSKGYPATSRPGPSPVPPVEEDAFDFSEEGDQSALPPVKKSRRDQKRNQKQQASPTPPRDRNWGRLSTGLFINAFGLAGFILLLAFTVSVIVHVSARAAEPEGLQAELLKTKSLVVLELAMNGCGLLIVASHIFFCMSPIEMGVRSIAKMFVLVDVLLVVAIIGFLLTPAFSEADIALASSVSLSVWWQIQACIYGYYLMACVDFFDDSRLFGKAKLAHRLSIWVPVVGGFGWFMIYMTDRAPSWMGLAVTGGAALLSLALLVMYLLSITVSIQLGRTVMRQARELEAVE